MTLRRRMSSSDLEIKDKPGRQEACASSKQQFRICDKLAGRINLHRAKISVNSLQVLLKRSQLLITSSCFVSLTGSV